jgi:hypothetical protein
MESVDIPRKAYFIEDRCVKCGITLISTSSGHVVSHLFQLLEVNVLSHLFQRLQVMWYHTYFNFFRSCGITFISTSSSHVVSHLFHLLQVIWYHIYFNIFRSFYSVMNWLFLEKGYWGKNTIAHRIVLRCLRTVIRFKFLYFKNTKMKGSVKDITTDLKTRNKPYYGWTVCILSVLLFHVNHLVSLSAAIAVTN